MRKRLLCVLVLVLTLAAVAACGKGKPATAQPAAVKPAAGEASKATPTVAKAAVAGEETSSDDGEAARAGSAASPTPEAADAEASAPENEATPEAAAIGDELSLGSRSAGLDKLKSYRMRWQSEWSAAKDGKMEKASWDWTEEYSSDPQALHSIWKVNDASSTNKGGNMEMWQIGQTSYLVMADAGGQGNCMSFSSEDQKEQFTKGLFSPDSLGSVSGARLVGLETVNDIATKHYKYDQKAASLAGYSAYAGEIWVAVDGGYVVKDTASWQGGPGLFGGNKDENGDGGWTWELSEVNQPIAIRAPENCGGAANSLPVMADASNKSTMGDIITYNSASKLAEVVAFYQKEMPAAGWVAGEGEATVTEELGMLDFSKDNQKAQVMISVSDGKTQVMISVSK